MCALSVSFYVVRTAPLPQRTLASFTLLFPTLAVVAPTLSSLLLTPNNDQIPHRNHPLSFTSHRPFILHPSPFLFYPVANVRLPIPYPTPTTNIAVMSTPSGTTSRRVPPPCWTHEETLVLINAYKEKWFALRRGNLRASDWDDVSSDVSSGSSSKSSIQCRHKIEKLRKRYRAEKQRWLNHPGKFSSSWDLFPMLDAMGFASTPVVGSYDPYHYDADEKINAVDVFRLKLKKVGKFDGDSDSNVDFDHGYGGGYGVEGASRSSEKNYVKIEGDFKANHDFDYSLGGGYRLKRKLDGDFKAKVDFDRNLGGWFDVKMQGNKGPVPQGIRFRSYDKSGDRSNPVIEFDHSVGGFPVKTLGDRSLVPPGFKPKYYGKVDGIFSPNLDYDDDRANREGGFRAKFSSDWDSVPQGFRPKRYGRTGENLNSNADFRDSNGFASSSRSGYGKSGSNPVKREWGPVEEVVSSVKMLTKVFVKMETMKMEMAREIEKMRMEMELKHSQMVLESQQQIVDAFAEALFERKKKAKVVVSPNRNGNGDELK